MDDPEWTDQSATVQRACPQRSRVQLLSDGRFRQQGDAGADRDRLLDVLDVVKLELHVDGRPVLTEKAVHFPANDQSLVEGDVLLAVQPRGPNGLQARQRMFR